MQAVRATVATTERRARIYRWVVIAAAPVLVAPVLVASIWLSWRPLSCIALLVPVAGAFLVIDSWTVRSWQQQVVRAWLEGHLRLADLRHTVLAMRHLPMGTLVGMLDRLPASEPAEWLDELSMPQKESVAASCLARAHRQDRRTMLSASGATLLACAVVAAASVGLLVTVLLALTGLILIVWSQSTGGKA